MENIPSIIIVSCSNTKPKSLIKLITKETTLNEESIDNGIIIQPWLIDTKYYTAQVNLIGLDEKFKRTPEFISNIEALIIHMDSNKTSGLQDLRKWDEIQTECDLDVKLLVANYCTDDTKVTRSAAMEWCLKRGFELIELYPTTSDQIEEEIIVEKIGVERIIEALQTHAWSNLDMKSKSTSKPIKESAISGDKESKLIKGDDVLTEEGLDDFSELFSQLHMMKSNFQSLPTNQRKQCAEQMVTAFWKAIGGEEEELLDL